MEYKALIAEDERDIGRVISSYLSKNGFEVDTVGNGADACAAVDRSVYDVIILDIMMPQKDGREVCRYIRGKYDVPVIFLTALDSENDVINGYELGADEYVTKPFSMPVLFAKIKMLIKRYRGLVVENGIITIGKLQIKPAGKFVYLNGKRMNIAPKEYDLLMFFIENKNRVLSRERILDNVWGPEFEGFDRVVDSHVKKLRKALGNMGDYIKTMIKSGYMWSDKEN